MVSGIYLIKNLINNKVYVGQTNNLICRKLTHFNLLKRNKHNNKYLQNSFNKYKESNFLFSILEFSDDMDERNFLENYYIKYFNSIDNKCGYNQKTGGVFGCNHSQQTIEKIKDKIRGTRFGKNNPFYGKKHTEEFKKRMSKIKIGQTGPKFKHTELYKLKMSLLKRGIPSKLKGKKVKPQHIRSAEKSYWFGKFGKNNGTSKKLLATNPEGIEMCFYCLREAAEFSKCTKGNISSVCNGLYKHTKQWKFLWSSNG